MSVYVYPCVLLLLPVFSVLAVGYVVLRHLNHRLRICLNEKVLIDRDFVCETEGEVLGVFVE